MTGDGIDLSGFGIKMANADRTYALPATPAPLVDVEMVEEATRMLLVAIGEDPDREGLVDTPSRVARWWSEFIDYDPGNMDTTFDVESADQLVVVSGVKVWSLCEHHLLPFWTDLAIGYIADEHLLGLSKMGRMAHQAAHGLQVQERLVQQLADNMEGVLGHSNVAVLGTGEHLCMTIRGIATPHLFHTSVVRGVFLDKPEARAELLNRARA